MLSAYYSAAIPEFLTESADSILGQLAKHHPHDLDPQQRNAWLAQISILRRELKSLSEGWVAFEFSIPRMGKRVDNIIVLSGIVFVIEFKVGADQFGKAYQDQVVDYALDLKNFHAGSHDRPIVPIVIATGAPSQESDIVWAEDEVAHPVESNGTNLGELIKAIVESHRPKDSIDANVWAQSGYKPTPTIIEAAQALYQGHQVTDITRSDAGAINLSQTTSCIAEIIDEAKKNGHKAICFVTGVPGAGKTLAGLNLVTNRTKTHKDEHAVFLSGNGPLVEVLSEALARDEHERSKGIGPTIRKSDAERKVKKFIQNIMHFRDSSMQTTDAPIERVAVFDEAQRAWDKDHLANFMARKKGVVDFEMSEPEFLISVMDRHQGWCTVVCLIGGGQEINAGEAGLTEWFTALKECFPDWKVFTSRQLAHQDYHWGQDLPALLSDLDVKAFDHLHLAVSIRSFRAEKLSDFVGALVSGETKDARKLHEAIKEVYPIRLTRSLAEARLWLRQQARGNERIGLVASSGASRLKPHGINVHEKIDASHWFLNGKEDVRSSHFLEDPATEFDIQGLELDWAGVCWDADFRWVDLQWSFHKFTGTKWQNVNDPFRKAYLTNAYRVLLTRARQGLVIYIPRGDSADYTRPPSYYDGTAKYLSECGLETMEPI